MNGGRRRPNRSGPDTTGRPPRVRDDTIVAIATAPGRGAVAIIRLSGPDAERVARRVVAPWPRAPRRLERCRVHEPDAEERLLDDAMAAFFPEGGSYTGEPVVELHVHGGTSGPTAVRDACIAAGAREALPGEFTERALLNGRLDLAQAEAVGALVDARTRSAHRAALGALSGTLSRLFGALRDSAIELDALLAYDIDFPEEDQGAVHRDAITACAEGLLAGLRSIVRAAPAGPIARDGALVVLAGPPNAGKSSLLNALVGEARAIVSDQPGTTRDAVEVLVDAEPWPVRFVDTAGLRANPEPIERLGIEVSERYLRAASVVMACAEEHEALARVVDALGAWSNGEVIPVWTKRDLAEPGDEAPRQNAEGGLVGVSTHTGAGLDVLWARVMAAVGRAAGSEDLSPGAALTARQRAALEHAQDEVQAFLACWTGNALPVTICATHVRGAIHALDELIGPVTADDVLTRVFSTFCVGK
ncbi:MAG: tRNA uridine-5-carboxymethylaminomethyl(34) synthesis GTPase MnmE [Gemmatimonadota bacterium]|nr:tRNA uridine-5-carboxymethylaminomethyl(34) synthesis GTPase MnmE [Gemmatimonadota bacterium]